MFILGNNTLLDPTCDTLGFCAQMLALLSHVVRILHKNLGVWMGMDETRMSGLCGWQL